MVFFNHLNKIKLHTTFAVFQVPITQNNQYTKVAYFGVAYSVPPQQERKTLGGMDWDRYYYNPLNS